MSAHDYNLNVRPFDLKTIVSTGWHHSLIPDDYLIAEHFQAEKDTIEVLKATITETQGKLAEAVENVQEIIGNEPDQDEKVSVTEFNKVLKSLIDDMKGSSGTSTGKELKSLANQNMCIKVIEKRVREARVTLNEKLAELQFRLELTRLWAGGIKDGTQTQIAQADDRLTGMDPEHESDKKTITSSHQDKDALNAGLTGADAVPDAAGGQISEADTRQLILKKIYDINRTELDCYLNTEFQFLVQAIENLWEKYSVTTRFLNSNRANALKVLDDYLVGLGSHKTGLMHDLLTRGIDEHGDIRSEHIHKFQDSLLGRIPIEWTIPKFRDIADIRVSNIDKKTYATERAVKLCNYLDVYANDYVTSAHHFMPATASSSEIERFEFHAGDIINTKDSETPDDIGATALVLEYIDGLVYGYHLALIRPKESMHPIFQAKQLASASTI